MLTAPKRPMLWTGLIGRAGTGRDVYCAQSRAHRPHLVTGDMGKDSCLQARAENADNRRTDETGHENYDIGLTKDTSYQSQQGNLTENQEVRETDIFKQITAGHIAKDSSTRNDDGEHGEELPNAQLCQCLLDEAEGNQPRGHIQDGNHTGRQKQQYDGIF